MCRHIKFKINTTEPFRPLLLDINIMRMISYKVTNLSIIICTLFFAILQFTYYEKLINQSIILSTLVI